MTNGTLCPECRSRAEQQPLSPQEAQACLLNHQSLEGKLLFRAGGLNVTRRFPGATAEDLNLSTEDRMKRIAELDIPTFGPTKVLKQSLIGMDYIAPLSQTVKEFTPQEGDVLTKTWVDAKGTLRSVRLPPYALADVHQYSDDFREYLSVHCKGWGKVIGGPFAVMAELIDSEKTEAAQKDFFNSILFFIFGALDKTQTGYLVGDETLDTPIIEEPGHRLDGKRVAPRMCLGQTDPLSTLAILIPAQKRALDQLTDLLESEDVQNWGPGLISVAALCAMGVLMFADRKRHAQENAFPGLYSVPEFVVDASSVLMILVAKFHKFEARVGRNAGLQASDTAIQKYFTNTVEPKMAQFEELGDEDMDRDAWWLGQLAAEQGDWIPRPTPCMVDYE